MKIQKIVAILMIIMLIGCTTTTKTTTRSSIESMAGNAYSENSDQETSKDEDAGAIAAVLLVGALQVIITMATANFIKRSID